MSGTSTAETIVRPAVVVRVAAGALGLGLALSGLAGFGVGLFVLPPSLGLRSLPAYVGVLWGAALAALAVASAQAARGRRAYTNMVEGRGRSGFAAAGYPASVVLEAVARWWWLPGLLVGAMTVAAGLQLSADVRSQLPNARTTVLAVSGLAATAGLVILALAVRRARQSVSLAVGEERPLAALGHRQALVAAMVGAVVMVAATLAATPVPAMFVDVDATTTGVAVPESPASAAPGPPRVPTRVAWTRPMKWSTELGVMSSVRPVPGGLLAQASDRLVMLDDRSGAEHWHYQHGRAEITAVGAGRNQANVVVAIAPVGWTDDSVTGGAVAPDPRLLVGLDARTGRQRWERPFARHVATSTEHMLVSATHQRRTFRGYDHISLHALVGIDAASGNDRWQWSVPSGCVASIIHEGLAGEDLGGSVVGAGSGVLVPMVCGDGRLHVAAVDERTGRSLWNRAYLEDVPPDTTVDAAVFDDPDRIGVRVGGGLGRESLVLDTETGEALPVPEDIGRPNKQVWPVSPGWTVALDRDRRHLYRVEGDGNRAVELPGVWQSCAGTRPQVLADGIIQGCLEGLAGDDRAVSVYTADANGHDSLESIQLPDRATAVELMVTDDAVIAVTKRRDGDGIAGTVSGLR